MIKLIRNLEVNSVGLEVTYMCISPEGLILERTLMYVQHCKGIVL